MASCVARKRDLASCTERLHYSWKKQSKRVTRINFGWVSCFFWNRHCQEAKVRIGCFTRRRFTRFERHCVQRDWLPSSFFLQPRVVSSRITQVPARNEKENLVSSVQTHQKRVSWKNNTNSIKNRRHSSHNLRILTKLKRESQGHTHPRTHTRENHRQASWQRFLARPTIANNSRNKNDQANAIDGPCFGIYRHNKQANCCCSRQQQHLYTSGQGHRRGRLTMCTKWPCWFMNKICRLRGPVYGLESRICRLRGPVYGLESRICRLRGPVYGLESRIWRLRGPV